MDELVIQSGVEEKRPARDAGRHGVQPDLKGRLLLPTERPSVTLDRNLHFQRGDYFLSEEYKSFKFQSIIILHVSFPSHTRASRIELRLTGVSATLMGMTVSTGGDSRALFFFFFFFFLSVSFASWNKSARRV